jgi:hypothetical protein
VFTTIWLGAMVATRNKRVGAKLLGVLAIELSRNIVLSMRFRVTIANPRRRTLF